MARAESVVASLGEFPWPLFAQRGYSIFIPNSRGRPGFGDRFDHAIPDDHSMNAVPATDVVSGVEMLVKSGRVDPERIGIAGHSYGGGVAAYALSISKRFRAASLHEAGSLFLDDSAHYDADPWRIALRRDYGMGSPMDPEQLPLLERDSPGHRAHLISTPCLLEFGLRENAATQGRQFFHALTYEHVPVEFVVFPRTGHITTEPVLIRDAFKRNLDWFGYWILGSPSQRMLDRFGPPTVKEWKQ
jgi:dipeptidyl aminopeptidase/acylaminoacyl peptidase